MFLALRAGFRCTNLASRIAALNYRIPKFSCPFAANLKMSSKRVRSISSNIDTSKSHKNSVKLSLGKDGSGEAECENIEKMTLQQWQSKLSSRNSEKCAVDELASFSKSTMNCDSTTLDQESSGEPNVIKTYSKRKGKGLDAVDHDPKKNKDSDISGVKKPKKRVKQQSDTVQIKKFQSTTEQELTVESIDMEGETSTRLKKKFSSKATFSVTDVAEEPWAVLTHKKPQKEWTGYNPRTMRPPPIGSGTANMKLISWNVNGLRALLKLEGYLLQLAERENFDVLCLQETKLQEKDVVAIRQTLLEGYDNSYWSCSVSKLGYSGTAIISRIKPLSVRYGLGISDHDNEGRLVTAEFENFYLLSGYVPNSSDGLKRLPYRINEWDPSLSNYMKELERLKPVVLTGDLNCCHQEMDIWNPAGNKRSAGFTDEERQSFQKNFLENGFIDTFRRQHPNALGYTYWGYRHGGRKTNKGWRLDYFLASESISNQVHDSYILPDVGGSDHCPIGLVLKL